MDPAVSVEDFSQLFEAHARFVWRALRYLGVREADLDDVCQEVFLIVYRKLSSFEQRSSIQAWLYGITLRVAADYRKSAYVRRERPSHPPPDTSIPSAAPQTEARQMLIHLLEQLEGPKREVLVLHDIEGLSMREAAEILDCPLQTAYTRYHAAREVLTKAMRRSRRQEAS